jgi:hypothetical protein
VCYETQGQRRSGRYIFECVRYTETENSRYVPPILMLPVDLSICPSNVGANTYSTALVIGEKAAAIIANELDLDL